MATLVNYGELSSVGAEIKIKSCYYEVYDENKDNCFCGNWEEIETLIQEKCIRASFCIRKFTCF